MNAFACTVSAAPRPGLMALEEALSRLLSGVEPLAQTEVVSSFEADGRVLAEDLVSALDVPGHDNASMDGYAVRIADVTAAAGQALPVTQRIAAGQFGERLMPGTVARIFTGAPVPEGADAVVMQEDTEAGEPAEGRPTVRFKTVPAPGQWIRRQGEDVRRGAVVLAAGQRLGPAELGLAASIGHDRLTVIRRVKVALFSTGDELVMPGEVPPEQMRPGAIYNSNRHVLRALLRRLGCEVTDMGIVPDQREATVQALREAAEGHDVILTSGGVSVGEEDHVKPAVQQLGGLDLWQVGMKPGKPFAHGWVNRAAGGSRCHFIGLPGNPVSSFVTFLLLASPFLRRLQGRNDPAAHGLPPALEMVAHFDLPRPDRRREFVRVRRNAQGGLDLFPNQSSGVLTSLAWADGLVDNPPSQPIAHGDKVRYFPLDALLG
ncbi:gephyrin-like molybdotransferase Glp [Tepidicella xavieri]|uniref:Molybdopterin molybdenumtransferase n=1 Tax=Tepidicella xavieri TaxID=360241 RepID=A0A4R6U973_9BURK|nr:gephyrin-like molybdotransferase Glp [Tepidicella xavieri]TDQ43138.1 molybdopterin molybdotransferase [Tepidicella xavieri]